MDTLKLPAGFCCTITMRAWANPLCTSNMLCLYRLEQIPLSPPLAKGHYGGFRIWSLVIERHLQTRGGKYPVCLLGQAWPAFPQLAPPEAMVLQFLSGGQTSLWQIRLDDVKAACGKALLGRD